MSSVVGTQLNQCHKLSDAALTNDIHADMNTTDGARSFTVSAAKAWNTLPNNIRGSATISIFKKHLFKAYFE